MPRTIANIEDVKQFVRASGSIGANYIEAKESGYWLRLLDTGEKLKVQRDNLVGEATELIKICGAIIRKSEE